MISKFLLSSIKPVEQIIIKFLWSIRNWDSLGSFIISPCNPEGDSSPFIPRQESNIEMEMKNQLEYFMWNGARMEEIPEHNSLNSNFLAFRILLALVSNSAAAGREKGAGSWWKIDPENFPMRQRNEMK